MRSGFEGRSKLFGLDHLTTRFCKLADSGGVGDVCVARMEMAAMIQHKKH